jgi:hypothetical protein
MMNTAVECDEKVPMSWRLYVTPVGGDYLFLPNIIVIAMI